MYDYVFGIIWRIGITFYGISAEMQLQNSVFHYNIKFYILRQNFHQSWFNDSENDRSPNCEMVHELKLGAK